MKDTSVGVVTVVVGALFCFRGYLAMRIVIPVWGAFAGFLLGAGSVEAISGDGFLHTTVGWLVGLALALVFFLIAYTYYEVSVVLAMTAVGFSVGAALMGALGVRWQWVIVVVGVAVGVLLAWLAIVSNLPMGLLTVLTALAGATTVITGAMLVTGKINVDDFDHGVTTQHTNDNPWWYVFYGALVIAGIVSQVATVERMSTSLREAWREDGGRQLRPA